MNLRLDCDFSSAFSPDQFFFGVANAPYLQEGGYNTPDGPKNNYGYFEADGRVLVSGDTVSFWEDYEEHIELAASLGLTAYRTGIEWARVQPTTELQEGPEPAWDEEALDHYALIVGSIQAHGMQPILTLHHFSHPAWLGVRMWLDDDKAALTGAYELRVVEELNRRLVAAGHAPANHFITFNELNLYPQIYYLSTLRDLELGDRHADRARLAPAYDNVLSTHIRIYDGLHDLFEREGWGSLTVGFGTASAIAYELDRQALDMVRLRTFGVGRDDIVEAVAGYRERWTARMRALARAKLTDEQFAFYEIEIAAAHDAVRPEQLTKTIDALYASPRAQKQDFISVNVYEPFRATRGFGVPEDAVEWWEFGADSDVYLTFIRANNDGNVGLPVFMGENSLAYRQGVGEVAQQRPDGWTRERYLKTYLMTVVRAIIEGVPIHGYLYWGLVDDFEWENGFEPRLGLYNYDYVQHRIGETDGLGEEAGKIYAWLIAALRSGDKARIYDAFTRRYDYPRG